MAVNQMTYHQPNQGGQPPAPVVKPPRKNPYRDGISKSAQNYDLYEAIRHPNKRQSQRPPINPASDKPLSKQKRLEKEIYDKFKKNNFTVSGRYLMMLGKVLKMFFLLLALPVYMLLYQLPKWFFRTILPAGIKRVEDFILKITSRFVAIFKKAYLNVSYPFKTLWKNLKNLAKKNPKSQQESMDQETGFFAFIAMGLWVMIRPFYHSVIWTYQTSKSSYFFIRSMPKKVRNFIQKIQHSIANCRIWILKVKESCIDILTLKTLRKKVMDGVQAKIAFFKELKKVILNKIKAKTNHFILILKNTPIHLIKKIRLSYDTAIKKMSVVQSKIKNIILSFWVPKKKILLNKTNILRNFGIRNINKLKLYKTAIDHYVEIKLKKPKKAILSVKARIIGKITQVKLKYWNPLQQWFKGKIYLLKQRKLPFSFPRGFAKNKVLNRFQILLNRSKNKIVAKLIWFKPFSNLILDISAFVNRGVVFAAGKLYERINPPLKFVKQTISYSILEIRVMIAWTSVLAKYGMILLSQTAQEIGWF